MLLNSFPLPLGGVRGGLEASLIFLLEGSVNVDFKHVIPVHIYHLNATSKIKKLDASLTLPYPSQREGTNRNKIQMTAV